MVKVVRGAEETDPNIDPDPPSRERNARDLAPDRDLVRDAMLTLATTTDVLVGTNSKMRFTERHGDIRARCLISVIILGHVARLVLFKNFPEQLLCCPMLKNKNECCANVSQFPPCWNGLINCKPASTISSKMTVGGGRSNRHSSRQQQQHASPPLPFESSTNAPIRIYPPDAFRASAVAASPLMQVRFSFFQCLRCTTSAHVILCSLCLRICRHCSL